MNRLISIDSLARSTNSARVLALAAIVASTFCSVGAVLAQPSTTETPAKVPAQPDSVRSTKEWNIGKKDKLAIQGYDPVAYFPEGGGKPAKGDEKFATEYKGVVYRFVSAEHRDLFLKDPAKYEPAHGGWCSWAMLDGDKVEVDAESFIVKDGRLFLFYKGWLGDTRAKWLKGEHVKEAAKADAEWKKISGESARMPKPEAKPESAPESKPAAKPADAK